MKTLTQFVRTTIVGGLFFLAPIVVLIVILAKAFNIAKKSLGRLTSKPVKLTGAVGPPRTIQPEASVGVLAGPLNDMDTI